MKVKQWLLAVSISLAAATVLAGCQNLPFGQKAEAQPLTSTEVKKGTLEITVTSSGSVVLPQITKMGFSGAVSGSQAGNTTVSELNVSMGSRVTKGQVIARLDTSAQERDLLRLRNNLDSAILALEKVKAPLYKPEEIAKAEAAVTSAKSNLAYAQEAFKKAQNPYTENDFAKAETAVRNARADVRNGGVALAKAEDDLQITIKKGELAVQDAMNNVIKLENIYDKSIKATDSDFQKANENLTLARRQAESDLTAGQNVIAKARDTLASAESALASAEFTLNDMLSKKAGDSLEVAQKQAALVSSQVALVNAEQTLSLMKQPPDPLDIKIKENQVTSAQLQVEDAKLQLEKSTIFAPFDGIIGDFKAKIGDTIQPGSFFIPIVDPTQARVDAFVEEYDVNNVRLGMPVVITMDAVRGQVFNGTVAAISPISTVQQGVVRYALTINIESPASGEGRRAAPAVRPGQRPPARGQGSGAANPGAASTELKDGLSATASIIVNTKRDVLLVPNRALLFQGGQQKVQVLVDGKAQDRVVKAGLANDQNTEITEGLSEGDKVLIQPAPGRQGQQGLPPQAKGIMPTVR